MTKLTKDEKRIARRAGITAADVHRDGVNSCGAVWALYNSYFYTRLTINGTSNRQYIYRALLRQFIKQLGVIEQ